MKLFNLIKLVKRIKRTPIFVYSKNKILRNISYLKNTGFKMFYALKANYNKKVISIISSNGIGLEVVSVRELKLAIKTGVSRANIIYSGACKTKLDIKFAIKMNIGFINVDSIDELRKINMVIKSISDVPALIVKINLNINVKTNRDIKTCTNLNKFGVYISDIRDLIRYIKKERLNISGLGFHLGSQIKDYRYYLLGVEKLMYISKKYNLNVRYINIGGGIAVDYKRNINYLKIILSKLKSKLKLSNIIIIMEPGRSLVANSCFTLTKVIYKKKNNKKRFAIVDIGMESIIRPMLYKSYHNIISYSKKRKKLYDIVGPICESTDILGKGIDISISRNDILAVLDTGAYCTSMRMEYNMRRKPIELVV
ncbi:diaminopimelate decarboxylase [Candidatus Vidania fulgoroideae]|uniref:Diaminopimelate decarboxylase n=1 Tax=Candidatus Vidania fulgoroideorum TaxID=881286 RepID=A0A974X7G3_9PROT|nr:diaminopimelate decarboxylase [Candidatus Vidania fulgoroideae]